MQSETQAEETAVKVEREADCTVKTVHLWIGMACHHCVLSQWYHSCINGKINKSNGEKDVCVYKLNGYFFFGLAYSCTLCKWKQTNMNMKVYSRCCLLLLCSSCIVFNLVEFDNSVIFMEKAEKCSVPWLIMHTATPLIKDL